MKFHFRGHKTNRVPKWTRKLFRIKALNQFECEKLNSLKSNYEKCISYDECNPIKIKDETQQRKKSRSIHKIFELIRDDLQKTKLIQVKKNESDSILIEWKELGRKVETIFFFINLSIVFILPSLLFYKYLSRNLSADISLQKHCKC